MNTVMQERIVKFNTFVMEQDIEKIPVGLFNGKMGICIYFYQQARLTQNKKYERFAGKLLDSLYSQVHKDLSVGFENGLIGICYGINYLLENDFVKGNVNYILKEFDDKIFQKVYFSKNSFTIDEAILFVQAGLHFCSRLSNKNLAQNEKILFENMVIRLLNTIETNLVGIEKNMAEPFFFSPFVYFPVIYLKLLQKIYSLDFYNYKIDKVCDIWNDRLLSTYPLLQSHRFLLAKAMENVNKKRKHDTWQFHIEHLIKQSNIDYIISTEFKNKNISLNSGVSFFYFLLKDSNMLSDKIKVDVALKLTESEFWNDFEQSNSELKKNYISLMIGLSGVILVYQDTQK